MSKKRFPLEEIIGKPRETDVLLRNGEKSIPSRAPYATRECRRDGSKCPWAASDSRGDGSHRTADGQTALGY